MKKFIDSLIEVVILLLVFLGIGTLITTLAFCIADLITPDVDESDFSVTIDVNNEVKYHVYGDNISLELTADSTRLKVTSDSLHAPLSCEDFNGGCFIRASIPAGEYHFSDSARVTYKSSTLVRITAPDSVLWNHEFIEISIIVSIALAVLILVLSFVHY